MEFTVRRLTMALEDDHGSTTTEYALIAALTAIFAIAALTYMTTQITNIWHYVADTVGAAI